MNIKPKRIQRKRTKGWRMPKGAICIDRSTRWGNPFSEGGRELCVKQFREWLAKTYIIERRQYIKEIQRVLRGKDLVCWCPLDEPCHGDVLLEIANEH